MHGPHHLQLKSAHQACHRYQSWGLHSCRHAPSPVDTTCRDNNVEARVPGGKSQRCYELGVRLDLCVC
eukprot:6462550-Pyramimonas_sp.AAC.1